MISGKASVPSIVAIVIIGFIFFTALSARGEEAPFPSYGSGAVQVRIYTDYFCPPCRAMEPSLEPVLRKLIKKNLITLTLVDTPFYPHSALYARYFLYTLNKRNNFEHALKVRNLLFDTAADGQITKNEEIENLFKNKKIPFSAFDPRPAFDRFNTLLKEDNIEATPTCVIVREGNKETFIGGKDILNALGQLQR